MVIRPVSAAVEAFTFSWNKILTMPYPGGDPDPIG
jgi:hypothetical protein